MLYCFQANFRKQQTSQLLPPLPIPPSPSPPLPLSLCMPFRGVASFWTNYRPGWLSFPHILKIACITSTHWPHQHFELLGFLAYPNNAWFIKKGRVIKPKIWGPWSTGLWAGYAPAFTHFPLIHSLLLLSEDDGCREPVVLPIFVKLTS